MYRLNSFLIACMSILLFCPTSATGADAPTTKPATSANYELAIKQYMAGQLDELEETLKAKDLLALKGQERADITYIRQSFIETRPTWWKQVKTNKKTAIHYMVFGRSVDAIFDPAGKGGVSMTVSNNKVDMSLSWPAVDMDNTAQAEHGFTKGELTNLTVFCNMGLAAAYPSIPQSFMQNADEAKKALLFRVLEFQADLAGTYYGSVRARQWGLWLYMHSYLDKYAKMQTVNARKAVALALIMEVVANPEKYPSIKLPARLEAEKTEEKLVLAIHQPLEKKGWTLAEDKAIREAIKSLSSDNPVPLTTNGKIKLPAGQFLQLDPVQDEPLRTAREAWFKSQFESASKRKKG